MASKLEERNWRDCYVGLLITWSAENWCEKTRLQRDAWWCSQTWKINWSQKKTKKWQDYLN